MITDVIGVADHVDVPADVSDDVSDDELVVVVEVVVGIVGVGDMIIMIGGAGFDGCTAGADDDDDLSTGDGVIVELVKGV